MNDTPDPTPTTLFYQGKVEAFDQTFDAWTNQTLLNSMEAGGVDWPSSCRAGTCRTCIGKLVNGEVHYKIDWPGLSKEEKEEGYVLPCCAYPDSDVVLREGY
jgi:ferredoxin